jgi:glycosyltransferase involved in cell wall biosynthesis
VENPSWSEKMNVAVISSVVGKTPEKIVSSFVFEEAFWLAKMGVKVCVVRSEIEGYSYSYGMHFYGLRRRIDAQAIESILKNFRVYPFISFWRSPLTIYNENLYVINVSDVVAKNKIDLIHAHFAYPEGLVGLLAKKRTGKPLVVTCHGQDILTEPSVGYGLRLSKRADALINKVLNSADAVITASQAAFDEVRKIMNDDRKAHLIPNAVDIQRFNPRLNGSAIRRRLGIREESIVVFALRYHKPKYGLEYLIRAVPFVSSEREDVVFVVGGDGPLKPYHMRLASSLNVKQKVIFTGEIPRDDVPYYYAMSDIVVVPSLQEAFGLVVSEAMACGKPVIGTKVGGIPEQIIDGYNGLLIEPKNPVQIAEKIMWLIDNPKEARRMGENGRKIVEEKFDMRKRIEKIISIYKMLLN